MKGTYKFIGILLTVMLAVSMMLPVMAVVPHPASAMWIEPSSINLNTATHDVGHKFNVTVWVNVTEVSDTWQIFLLYDISQINVSRVGYTNEALGRSQFYEAFPTTPVEPVVAYSTYYASWYVLFGETCAPKKRDPGYGSLCWIEFIVKKAPEKGQLLTSTLDITATSPDMTYVLNPDTGNPIALTPYNASYTFTWSPPPAATLRVHNPGPLGADSTHHYVSTPNFFFNKSVIWNCTWFTVDIYLDISSAWYITNASFSLSYNTALIDTTPDNITIYAFPGLNEVNIVHGDPDRIDFILRNPCGQVPIGGAVLIATIKFHIHGQPMSYVTPQVESPLTFSDVILWDHFYEIPTNVQNGLVTVQGYQLITPPWIEVEPPVIVMGPEPSICKIFEVNVTIKELDARWHMVGFGPIRLTYPTQLIEFVEGIEGPFMQDPRWNLHGTFPICHPDDYGLLYPWHILMGDLLIPDEHGVWAAFPEGSGVLFTLRFHVIYQSYPHNLTCPLNFIEILLVNDMSEEIPVDWSKVVNGTYQITTNLPGRMIDVYTQYPAPYGGQGPNNPSDMFWPQRIVYLYAEVTYNYYPVTNKDVGFEIEGPFDQETGQPLPRYQIWYKGSARTDKDGIAWIKFQLPWPCQDPEGLFGKWKVTATVDICEVVVVDTLTFDYQYVVTWTTVRVDREPLKEYKHCEYVEVTVEFKSKAQQPRWVLITVVIEDNLQTPIGIAWTWILVGGAEPCHWKQYVVTLSIHIPQHAFAGPAWIHVNAFTDDPTVGGVAWCPEYSPLPEIYIQPY